MSKEVSDFSTKLRMLLEEANRVFPLPADFKGRHSITIDGAMVTMQIWAKSTEQKEISAWSCSLDPHDFDFDKIGDEFEDLRSQIDAGYLESDVNERGLSEKELMKRRVPATINHRRLLPEAGNPREVAFVEEWKQQHVYSDLLTLLLMVPVPDGQKADGTYRGTGHGFLNPIKALSIRERTIVASVIQWLGTNVGYGFIHMAMQRAGYDVRLEKVKSKS
jgi:hypothetical protein